MKDDIINIINKAEEYFNSTSKKHNVSDNKVFKYIIEKLLDSEFVIVSQEKIVYASSNYNNLIGCDISSDIKDTIKNSVGFRKNYLELANKRYFQGIVWGTEISYSKTKKGFMIIKFNPKNFVYEILPTIYKARDYIYLY